MRVLRFIFIIMLAGCSASNSVIEFDGRPAPETAELSIAGDWTSGLNVSIRIFGTDKFLKNSIYVSAAHVREVERRYLPYMLKQTLDRSGFWGAVRVLPKNDPSAEINITATIMESSGVNLDLRVRVATATGDIWVDKIYQGRTDETDYTSDPDYMIDTFQDVYNRIANDMSFRLLELSGGGRRRIIDAALMLYGAALSPKLFSRYIESSGTGNILTALPARDDPILSNLYKIRDSEYLFADSVDAHYEKLYRTVGPTYAWWRYYSFELIRGNERLEGIDAARGATKGSWYSMERIYKIFKEAKMNQDALRELSESFERETTDTAAEVAGRVVELSGRLDHQYDTWRRILRTMYEDAAEPKTN